MNIKNEFLILLHLQGRRGAAQSHTGQRPGGGWPLLFLPTEGYPGHFNQHSSPTGGWFGVGIKIYAQMASLLCAEASSVWKYLEALAGLMAWT